MTWLTRLRPVLTQRLSAFVTHPRSRPLPLHTLLTPHFFHFGLTKEAVVPESLHSTFFFCGSCLYIFYCKAWKRQQAGSVLCRLVRKGLNSVLRECGVLTFRVDISFTFILVYNSFSLIWGANVLIREKIGCNSFCPTLHLCMLYNIYMRHLNRYYWSDIYLGHSDSIHLKNIVRNLNFLTLA